MLASRFDAARQSQIHTRLSERNQKQAKGKTRTSTARSQPNSARRQRGEAVHLYGTALSSKESKWRTSINSFSARRSRSWGRCSVRTCFGGAATNRSPSSWMCICRRLSKLRIFCGRIRTKDAPHGPIGPGGAHPRPCPAVGRTTHRWAPSAFAAVRPIGGRPPYPRGGASPSRQVSTGHSTLYAMCTVSV